MKYDNIFPDGYKTICQQCTMPIHEDLYQCNFCDDLVSHIVISEATKQAYYEDIIDDTLNIIEKSDDN